MQADIRANELILPVGAAYALTHGRQCIYKSNQTLACWHVLQRCIYQVKIPIWTEGHWYLPCGWFQPCGCTTERRTSSRLGYRWHYLFAVVCIVVFVPPILWLRSKQLPSKLWTENLTHMCSYRMLWKTMTLPSQNWGQKRLHVFTIIVSRLNDRITLTWWRYIFYITYK